MLINKYERNSRDTKSPTDAKTIEWKSDEEYNFQSFPPNKLVINYKVENSNFTVGRLGRHHFNQVGKFSIINPETNRLQTSYGIMC